MDLRIGRRLRPLGPIQVEIDAPRETVFAVAAAPYAERSTRALRQKVTVLERAGSMVVAAHRTPVRGGLTAITVESVGLEPPSQISFRLLRGPVPHVVETFSLDEFDSGTRLTYDGELGTDLWWLGQQWGQLVARAWEQAVRESVAAIKAESERRTG